MPKGLLFIGGSIETVPALDHARDLGCRVHVTDGRRKSPGIQWAIEKGEQWRVADTYSGDQTYKAALTFGSLIDGVIAVGCDVGPTVSFVAELLGLPCVPKAIARLGWDKLKQTMYLQDRGIPVAGVPQQGDVRIVKPVDSRGARGVYRLLSDDDVDQWREISSRYSPTGRTMVERWVPGPQISTESLIHKGEVIFTGTADRNYGRLEQFGRHVIEDGGETPSYYDDIPTGEQVRELVASVVEALGIEDGTIKCDVVLDTDNGDRPTIIECALGRMSGGAFCTTSIPLAYGIDFMGAAFAIACGDNPFPYLKERHAPLFCCQRFSFPVNPTSHVQRGESIIVTRVTRKSAMRDAERWVQECRTSQGS